MRCSARRDRQVRQAPQEVVSLGGPVGRAAREERRGRGRALLALRCHRRDLRPTGFEMAAVLRVYPELVGERRVGRSVPHPLGLTAAAAGSAPARPPSMRPRPWSVGIRSAAVAVWRAPHLQYSAHSARTSQALSCLTSGSTARRRSESTAHWESPGAPGIPGIPGAPLAPRDQRQVELRLALVAQGGGLLDRRRPCRGRIPPVGLAEVAQASAGACLRWPPLGRQGLQQQVGQLLAALRDDCLADARLAGVDDDCSQADRRLAPADRPDRRPICFVVQHCRRLGRRRLAGDRKPARRQRYPRNPAAPCR